MTAQSQVLKIRRPDDWHIHLRDDDMLKTVVPYTSEFYGRAIVMPNLVPPVTTVAAAIAYRQRIMDAVPAGHDFTPLMTCYLTDSLDPAELERGFNEGVFTAAKLYPANATTNSSHGVTSTDAIMPVLERMEKLGMPLLVHGEVTHAEIDIFDREARFIETVMEPLRQRLPGLKVVFEHITTKDAAEYVRDGNELLAATITPQHLMFNRNQLPNGDQYYGFPAEDNELKIGKHNGGQPISTPQERVAFGAVASDGSESFPFLRNVLPGIGGCLHGASCTYDNTVDEDFIIDTLPGRPDTLLITGLSGHGFKFAPVLGEIASQFAQGEASSFNLAPFSLARFNA
ncbi:TPA: dihydroorotase [Klebsiella pneumoniae]|nr:dihydroorotase [Klebsiella pneumoniae]